MPIGDRRKMRRMNAPSPPFRALLAAIGYTSVHWVAGRWRRALLWDALLVATVLLIFWLPLWALFAVMLAQIVDAALLRPARDRPMSEYERATVIAAGVGIVLALTLRFVWVEAFKIPAGSMIPTLQVGDHMWVKKFKRTPARGDVIVFKYPKEPDKDFVKRAVAVGGDTIRIRDNQLFINGQPVPRKHVDEPCEYDDYLEESGRWEKRTCEAWDETLDGRTYRVIFDRNEPVRSWPAVTVPPGHTFVMGDNRDNSHDSRYWGFVPPDYVKGTASKIWWSSGPDGVRWDRIDRRIR
jgi:signal peptidase I